MIGNSIRTRLIAGGLSSGDRVFVDYAPESTPKPYTVIYEIGGELLYAQEAPVGLRQRRIQVSVFAASGNSVSSELDAIRNLLHYADWSDSYVSVQSVLAIEEPAITRESEAEIYHGHVDYRIHYE